MTKIELTRRRILGGLVTIGAGSAAAGAGTFALFSDTETSNDNTLSAGTLDLVTGDTSTLNFTEDNIVPGDAETADIDLEKSGSTTADLTVSVTDVSSTEGELDDQMELDIWLGTGGSDDNQFDNDGNDTFDADDDIVLNSGGNTGTSPNPEIAANYNDTEWTDVITDFSGPVTFNVDWEFVDDEGESFNNNDARGDDITIDFEFELVQQS